MRGINLCQPTSSPHSVAAQWRMVVGLHGAAGSGIALNSSPCSHVLLFWAFSSSFLRHIQNLPLTGSHQASCFSTAAEGSPGRWHALLNQLFAPFRRAILFYTREYVVPLVGMTAQVATTAAALPVACDCL